MGKVRQRNRFSEESQPAGRPVLGSSVKSLIAICERLGARTVPGWSDEEELLASDLPYVPEKSLRDLRDQIAEGLDPLGEMFCQLRSAEDRRSRGATYTPIGIVRTMVDWAQSHATPDRIVDAGVGSGRFIVEAGRRFPQAALIGVELDPLAAILARAHLATSGLVSRSQIVLGDYRKVRIPIIGGRTLFIGNPPYVRHQLIEATWKTWLVHEAMKRGLSASQLAGLHVHFLLATVMKARAGDFGAFITAAEWLDNDYGRLLRDLFLADLGGQRLTVIEPTARPFPDAATTAVITAFEIGSRPKSIVFKRATTVEDLGTPGGSTSSGVSGWKPSTAGPT
jgi:methylase of polypeptide subunit release factors